MRVASAHGGCRLAKACATSSAHPVSEPVRHGCAIKLGAAGEPSIVQRRSVHQFRPEWSAHRETPALNLKRPVGFPTSRRTLVPSTFSSALHGENRLRQRPVDSIGRLIAAARAQIQPAHQSGGQIKRLTREHQSDTTMIIMMQPPIELLATSPLD